MIQAIVSEDFVAQGQYAVIGFPLSHTETLFMSLDCGRPGCRESHVHLLDKPSPHQSLTVIMRLLTLTLQSERAERALSLVAVCKETSS